LRVPGPEPVHRRQRLSRTAWPAGARHASAPARHVVHRHWSATIGVLTVADAAEQLQVTERFTRELIAQGGLRAVKVGVRIVRIRRADLSEASMAELYATPTIEEVDHPTLLTA